MTMEKLEMLSRIYNTLLTVSTKGEDTVTMGECLKALRQFILSEKENIDSNKEE